MVAEARWIEIVLEGWDWIGRSRHTIPEELVPWYLVSWDDPWIGGSTQNIREWVEDHKGA